MSKDMEDEKFLNLEQEPIGKNEMSSRSIYLERKKYNIVSFDTIKETPIDLQKKILYGKTNTDAVSFVLNNRNELKQISNSSFVLNFVADAFKDLQNEFVYLALNQITDPNSPFYSFEAKKAWQDVDDAYYAYMQKLYKKFISYIVSYSKQNKIINFESFLNEFIGFIDVITPGAAITRGKFIFSRETSQHISGLVIDLETDDNSSDQNKFINYINSPNFPIFSHSCEKFSFKIDKHVPWRIIFDLRSPQAQNYYNNYTRTYPGLNKDNVLKNYYKYSFYGDLNVFKTYIKLFYNSFASNNKSAVREQYKVTKNKVCVKSETITRQEIGNENFNLMYPDSMWIRLYLFMRAREENLNWNQKLFEKYANNACLLYTKNEDDCYRYIFNKTNFVNKSQIKNRNFYFK